MSDLLIFGIGSFVTSAVLGAILVLEWAALTTEDSRDPYRSSEAPSDRSTKKRDASVQPTNSNAARTVEYSSANNRLVPRPGSPSQRP